MSPAGQIRIAPRFDGSFADPAWVRTGRGMSALRA
jgi:hypothetical protein